MKKIFHFFVWSSFVAVSLLAQEFGNNVQIKGIWKIDTAQKDTAFNLASSIGYTQSLKFDIDGKVYKLNPNTLKAEASHHTWSLKDGVINIKFKTPNDSFIANFIFNDNYNDYLKIDKQTSNNCYHVILQNGKKQSNPYGIVMCRIIE